MSKFHICGVTQSGEEDNIKQLLEPLESYYTALQWVWHGNYIDAQNDETYGFLDVNKKEGKIIKTDWCYRLDFSRNHFLYQGTMKFGEWFCILDSLELLKPEFFFQWPGLRYLLESNNIDGVQLYGKRFLYKFNDFLEFRGNPHEGLIGANKVIELTTINGFKDTSWFWKNLRPEKRDKYHYIWAFVNYYTNYPNSNHCLLGLDKYNNKEEIFKIREYNRRKFRDYCDKLSLLPLTIDGFKNLCINRLDEIKEFINYERILNDAYHYFILNNHTLDDPHDLSKIIKID